MNIKYDFGLHFGFFFCVVFFVCVVFSILINCSKSTLGYKAKLGSEIHFVPYLYLLSEKN